MSIKEHPSLEGKLKRLSDRGILRERSENNPYLKYSYKGAGDLVSEKWNVKVYNTGSVVCNDLNTLNSIVKDTLQKPNTDLKLLQIDDAGIGFPLLGVMVGVTDGESIWTDTVDVSFFKKDAFNRKLYLKEYAKKGIRIINNIKASPSTHRIEICSGYINTKLKDMLRNRGYDVRVVEIKGLLQDKLEILFKKYVKEQTGEDLAYDPKECNKSNISSFYDMAVNWGVRNNKSLLKTGWKSLNYLEENV